MQPESEAAARPRSPPLPSTTSTVTTHLRIDNVLASQPEAGPVVPDGGYGWVVLVASFYVKNIISGLSIAHGLLMLFSSIETGLTNAGAHDLWSNPVACTPLLCAMVCSMSDPVCRLIVRNSKWPRFVALVGICVICASILMLWLSLVDGFARVTLYAFSGVFAGFGTSLVCIQIDALVKQYFRHKLPAVEGVLRVAEYTGVIYSSVVLGKNLSVHGLPHTIIWYHLIALTGGVVVLVFKKPDYLKGGQQLYRVMAPSHEEDDEEAIFSKTTELQSPHTSLSPSTATVTVDESPSNRRHWETFDEDGGQRQREPDEELAAPRELFVDGHINNNVTYSFDHTDHVVTHSAADELANIFLPVAKARVSHPYLRRSEFYSNCLLHASIICGMFVLFTVFPSYLYFSVSYLHRDRIGYIVAVAFCVPLIAAFFVGCCWKFSRANRSLPIALFLWLSTAGNFLISDWRSEMVVVIGVILITTSNCTLQHLTSSIIANICKSRVENSAFRIVCGMFFVVFVLTSPTYQNCFRLVGLLQFLAGSLSFCSFVYEKIARIH